MGQRSGTSSHAGRLYGAAIIVEFSKGFSFINPPTQISFFRSVCRSSWNQNEKAITQLHETTRVTALSFTDCFLVFYAVLNIIAFLVFANDKRKAKNNAWRTPENLLLLVAAFGPFGAYASMLIFRHKTRKLKFYLVPIFLFVHVVAILYLLR